MKFQFTENVAKRFFWILFAIATVIMIGSAFDFPTNGDELEHIQNGKANVKFYTSLGKDTSYLNPPAPYAVNKPTYLLKYYAVFTDLTAEMFCGVVTKLGIDYMDGRHIWNVLLAMLGVLFTALTARLFTKSWWPASLALLIMLATPTYTGFAYNLTKDIPLATGFIMALYGLYYCVLNFDQSINKKALLAIVFGVGIAIGNRVAGLLLFGYAGLFGAYTLLKHYKTMAAPALRTRLLWIAGSMVAGYFVGLLFWPYGLISPFGHVFETFDVLSKFPLKMATLIDGENMDINQAYWYFLPKYMLVDTPILFLAGFALSILLLFYKPVRNSGYGLVFCLLLFPSVFPILYIIYSKAVVYQNWRHVMFVFPTMVVLASLGWYYLMKQGKIAYAAIPVFVLLFVKPVWWMIANHPYEYTYYNEFVGGTAGAYTNYEMDSYCFGVKECVKWIADHNDLKKDTLIIACNDDDPPIYYSRKYIKQPVKNVLGGFRSRNGRDWDYGIFNTLFLSKEEMEKFFPPQNAELVYTVLLDKSAPGYIILKRIDKTDMAGIAAYDHGNFALADTILSAYNRHTNYCANVTDTYELLAKLNTKRFNEAAALYDLLRSKNLTTMEMDYYGAVALANAGQLQRARDILSGAIESGLQDPGAAQLLQQLNQAVNAGPRSSF